MTPAIRIGDPVQVHDETEVLTLVCLDCGRAWVRDDVGNHFDYPEVDLHPPVSPKTFEECAAENRRLEHLWGIAL